MNRIRLFDSLQFTLVLTILTALWMPAMWFIDFLFAVFSDDPSVARYLAASAMITPVMIGIGLVFDTLRFLFPSLFEGRQQPDISASDRVAGKSHRAKGDDS